MGAPTKFYPLYPHIAARMRELGMSAREIAYAFGIGTATYWRWRRSRQTFKLKSTAAKNWKHTRKSDRRVRELGHEFSE
jgi:transposase